MNSILETLLKAKNNPHVFWPVLIGLGMKILFAVLSIWLPGHEAKLAQTKKMLDPIITTLISYATLAAANSGPQTPTQNTK